MKKVGTGDGRVVGPIKDLKDKKEPKKDKKDKSNNIRDLPK